MEGLEVIMSELIKRQQEQQQFQETVLRKRTEKILELFMKSKSNKSTIFSKDSVQNSIGKFKYNPNEEAIFVSYYRCYEEIFKKVGLAWSDEKKISPVAKKIMDHETQNTSHTAEKLFFAVNDVHCSIYVGNELIL